jgi:hypothetical protein
VGTISYPLTIFLPRRGTQSKATITQSFTVQIINSKEHDFLFLGKDFIYIPITAESLGRTSRPIVSAYSFAISHSRAKGAKSSSISKPSNSQTPRKLISIAINTHPIACGAHAQSWGPSRQAPTHPDSLHYPSSTIFSALSPSLSSVRPLPPPALSAQASSDARSRNRCQ